MAISELEQQKSEQQLDFSQGNIRRKAAGIIKETWEKEARDIIDLAIILTRLSKHSLDVKFDLMGTNFSRVFSNESSNPELKLILSERLTHEQQLLLPGLEHAKKTSPKVFTLIARCHGAIKEDLEKKLVAQLIKDPELFDSKLLDKLRDQGHCSGMTNDWLTRMALENEKIPGVKKRCEIAENEKNSDVEKGNTIESSEEKGPVAELAETDTAIVKWKPGDILKKEVLQKVLELASSWVFLQSPNICLPVESSQLDKTMEVKVGANVIKPKLLASVALVCSQENFYQTISKFIIPNVMIFIVIAEHAIGIYQTKKGIFCFDCNPGLWKLEENLNQRLENILKKYVHVARFPIAIVAFSFTYNKDYCAEISLEDLLKDQDPKEIVEVGRCYNCTLFFYATVMALVTSFNFFLKHQTKDVLLQLVDSVDYDHCDCLQKLIERGLNGMLKLLVKAGLVDVNGKIPGTNYTLLECAAKEGSIYTMDALVAWGARIVIEGDISHNDTLIKTIFAPDAFLHDTTLTALRLLEMDPRWADTVDANGTTPLMAAAHCGNIKVMERLIGLKADGLAVVDVKKKDNYGYDAWMFAIQDNKQEAIVVLKEHGATYDSPNLIPSFTSAVKTQNKCLIEIILDNPETDVDALDDENHSALHYVLCNHLGDPESECYLAVMKLLEKGAADVNLKDVVELDLSKLKDTSLNHDLKEAFRKSTACRSKFEDGLKLLFNISQSKSKVIVTGSQFAREFSDEFLEAFKQYPACFESLLYRLLTNPKIILKKFGISFDDLVLSNHIFRRILSWCNDHIKDFSKNSSLLLFLGELATQGKYIKNEAARGLLEKAQSLGDLPKRKYDLSLQLLDCLDAVDEVKIEEESRAVGQVTAV